MLVAFLCGTILFFAALCAFLAFDNAMLNQERAVLLRRARRAERAEQGYAEAVTARVLAERDALSAIATTVESQDKIARLSAHVRVLMRERSQLQSLQLSAPRRFQIDKSPDQIAATRSAHIN